jgi:hypothetical protein
VEETRVPGELIYEKNVTMLLHISLFVNSWQNPEMKVFLWSDCDSSFLSKIIFGNEMCSAWSKQLRSEDIWELNSYIYRGGGSSSLCKRWLQYQHESFISLKRIFRDESAHWWQKDDPSPYSVPKYPHFLAVWTKFENFYFQLFCSKKRKSTDQRKTFISGFTCSKKLSK